MNELPTKRVVFDRFDPMAVIVQAAAMTCERFEWEGEQWQVYALWHDVATGNTTADLQLAAITESVRYLQPSKASDLDPPAWCSCGKPAVRGGLCATEPAAPAIDYRDLLVRYVALIRWQALDRALGHPGGLEPTKPTFTEAERELLMQIGDEARERYPL